jgi:hypothetical protein
LTRFFFPDSIRIFLIPQPNHSELIPPEASFQQRFGSEARTAVALAVVGAIMMASNPWFTPVDDEIAIIDVAAKPAFATINLLVSGGGPHEHPPLSGPIQHGWL